MNRSTFIKSVLSAAAALSIIACAEQEQIDTLGSGSYLEMNAEEAAVYGLTSKLNQNTLQSTFSNKLNQKYVSAKSGAVMTTGYRVLLIEKDMKKAKIVNSTANFNIDIAQNLKMKTALIKSLKESNTLSLSLTDSGSYIIDPTKTEKVEVEKKPELATAAKEIEVQSKSEAALAVETEASAEEVAQILESKDSKEEVISEVETNTVKTEMKITRVNNDVIQLMEFELVSNKMNDIKTRDLVSISYFRPVFEREIKQIEAELVKVSGAMKAAQEKIEAKDAASVKVVEAVIKEEIEKSTEAQTLNNNDDESLADAAAIANVEIDAKESSQQVNEEAAKPELDSDSAEKMEVKEAVQQEEKAAEQKNDEEIQDA